MSRATIDPLADIETIETELMLADLDSLERRVDALEKRAKSGDKEAKERSTLDAAGARSAARGKAGAARSIDDGSRSAFDALNLLTSKPVLYVCNVDEARPPPATSIRARSRSAADRRQGARRASSSPRRSRRRSPSLPTREREEFLRDVGLAEPGLDRLIRAGYELLQLVTFFTVGPKEARAWTVHRRHQGAAGGRRDPHRFRTRLHPRRDDRL